MPALDARLAGLGLTMQDVAEWACEGCKNQDMVMEHDATCYETCTTFADAVTEEENKENV